VLDLGKCYINTNWCYETLAELKYKTKNEQKVRLHATIQAFLQATSGKRLLYRPFLRQTFPFTGNIIYIIL